MNKSIIKNLLADDEPNKRFVPQVRGLRVFPAAGKAETIKNISKHDSSTQQQHKFCILYKHQWRIYGIRGAKWRSLPPWAF